jgi:hypothetical protein
MTEETRDRKTSERRMNHPAKSSARRVLKLVGVFCVGMLILELAPMREGYQDDPLVEKSRRSVQGQHPTAPSSRKKETEMTFRVETFLSEGRPYNSRLEGRQLSGRTHAVAVKTSYGVGAADVESVENLERTVLVAMAPGAKIDAVEALTQTNEPEKATKVLSQVVLIDQNADVRLAALEALDEIDAIPFETLAAVAANDADSAVRLRAVELIGEIREKDARVVELLKLLARKDSRNEVGQLASNLLAAGMRGK